jgi:hypothetical protein
VPFADERAQKAIDWYREMEWLSPDEGVEVAVEKGMYCEGCTGDRSKHWSADCWILGCCVDDKGLENCSQCDEFPCSKLAKWSEQNERYQDALSRLKNLVSQQ